MTHIKSRKHTTAAGHSTDFPGTLPQPFPLGYCLSAAFAASMTLSSGALATDSEATLPTVHVSGASEGIKADKASSPKYTQPLLDTPQTITVIRKELISQQGGTTLTEALRNTPGVGTFSLGENGATATGDAIYMRGFDASANIYVDNVRDLGAISRDMFNIDQVEVLKGPSGTDNGRGAPNGSINLVTSQPDLNNSFNASATAGSASNKRATMDLNRVLDADKGMALRLNVVGQDSGVAGRDIVNNKRWGVAPSFVYGLGSATRLYVDYLHMQQNNRPEDGVSTIGLPGYTFPSNAAINSAKPVNPKNYYGSKDDFDKVNSDMLTVRVEHDFSPQLKLQNTTRYAKTSQYYQITGFMGGFATPVTSDPSTYTLARTRQAKDQTNEILTNQTNLTAEFDTGGIKHTAVGGFELTQEKQRVVGYYNNSLGTMNPANLYNPNPSDPVTGYNPVRSGVDTSGVIKSVSAYGFDTLKLGDRWLLSGGVRVDHYDLNYDYATASTVLTNPTLRVGTGVNQPSLSTSGYLFNWKVGAVYKLTPDSSLYASYSTSKQPPGGSNFILSTAANNAGNTNYDPQSTTSSEIGAKWDVLDKKLALTAALYSTKVTNEVSQDPVSLAYFQTGKKQVQGIEISAIGNITKEWSVSTGYTYMKTKVTGSSVASDGSSNLAYTPKQAFTSWTSYKLPQGFTIGGGARFVDALIRASDGAVGTPRYTNSYWVFDAMIGYAVSKNLDLQLNVYNLADKQYVAAINKSGYRYTPGIERAATLTANFRF
ncbi:catecholate siderophore receptor Fiu [Glaciimonas sp. PCH181]|uniref:catecholate siderophore receptor Fiu n=1 Tax=Glaciimonas sp. PCH181 TaxID=2133943 RepID=UPI000D36676C|nr:catecholate siderophore receptor Fiu [Glaciimonas sp. PCH181]PUA20781.1 catecholate siderophore receptor Fiu [Glaciimonas sp. PCH181]